MRKLTLCLFFLFVFFGVSGQTPGYMGKRFTVGYSNLLSPNFLNFAFDYKLNRAVLTHSLNVNYVISQQREMCISVRYSNRKIRTSSFDPAGGYNELPDFEKLSTIEYSLGFRRFNKAKFAPLGAYSKWDGQFMMCKMKYKDYLEYVSTGYASSTLVSQPGGSFNLKGFGFSYSRGRQRVFEHKYVVDFGIRGTLMVIYSSDPLDNHESNLSSDVSGSLNLNPIFNAFIGIGFLAF